MNIKPLGKFLDQPMLISKLNKNMPVILAGLGAAYFSKAAYDSFQGGQNEMGKSSKKELANKAIVLVCAGLSALFAPKIAGKLTKRAPAEEVGKIRAENTKLINDFLAKNSCDESCRRILEKAKGKVLSLGEVNTLLSRFKTPEGKAFMGRFIPEPQNIKAKDIFQEIGYLSIYGAVPVLGGIAGGIAADRITDGSHCREKVPDKINEGIYQYLANIFMCNIGAGAALGILEKQGITSKSARAIGMTAGIILTGVVGGSMIANLVTKNLISPILNPKKKKEEIRERRPEPLDIGLHTDDIATVSLLSGLKWIEPALPALYSVSGYRAGIGYRN